MRSDYPSDLFLEMHGLAWAGAMPDVHLGSGAWQAVGSAATQPRIDDEFFSSAT